MMLDTRMANDRHAYEHAECCPLLLLATWTNQGKSFSAIGAE